MSSGSSCTSSTLTPSHVLRAMGVTSEGNVRVSLPMGTDAADVERFLDVLPGVVHGVREKLGAPVAGGEGTAESVTVDALGMTCPQPVIELAKAIGRLRTGGTATVEADDEVAAVDIPAWCFTQGHTYVGAESREQGGAVYTVRRGI